MRFAMLSLLLCGAIPAGAQQVPIRQLSAAEAVTSEKLPVLPVVRPLSDGHVILLQGRRVLLFDADLKSSTVAMDSTVLTSGPLTGLPPTIVPGLADTTYVLDMGSASLLTIEPSGKMGRMMALPRAGDASLLQSFASITSQFDPKGRLVYRGFFPRPPSTMVNGRIELPAAPDTFPIVRADFDSRTADTLAVVRVPSSSRRTTAMVDGRAVSKSTIYPFPIVDVWTMLPDGTIAILRGADYHLDWVGPDGARSSTPKMPFDWRRITDDEKAHIIDSVTVVQARSRERMDSMLKAQNLDRASNSITSSSIYNVDVAPSSALPDYYPSVRDGAMRADPDGNLWILPTTSSAAQGGGLLYDIVNRKGEVFERVQLPPRCSLAGLGKGRAVYLMCVGVLERRRVIN